MQRCIAQKSCTFLGHLISKEGIQPPPERVRAIQDFRHQGQLKNYVEPSDFSTGFENT